LATGQCADSFNAIGRPESESGERTVPLPPMLVNVLRELRLAGPKGEVIWSSPPAGAMSKTMATSSTEA
jgi:hypothetical protein